MATIAKIHPVLGLPDPQLLATHPVMQQWLAPEKGLLARLRQAMADAGVSPARCVVLLPYAQLRPLAQRLWQQLFDDGFAPRFETTRSWTSALGAGVEGTFDLRQNRALDLLTAHNLLLQAGQSARADMLAPHLVDAAQQLAPLAAGRAPQQRAAWAQGCREMLRTSQGTEAGQWEALVAQVALEWVNISAYASDVLYTDAPWQQVDLAVQVCGLNADPLADGLQAHWGAGRWVTCPWMAVQETLALAQSARWRAHACLDAQDEARRSAACAVRHIQAGRFPLALVSSDRAFTRQIQVQLEAAGVSVRDETGWKLSTTRAGTYVMALLRAAVWNASTDTVLAWLKQAPVASAQVDALEALLRRYGVRDWAQVARLGALQKQPELLQLLGAIALVREPLQKRGTLTDALGRLRNALAQSGYSSLLEGAEPGLAAVPEGNAVLACLQLDVQTPLEWLEASQRTWSLAEFSAWVNQSLEAASWSPEYPQNEQVVLVPMSQLLARPFAAVLLCGCDEQRLPASVPPPGIWTRAQREALGLPSREALDEVQRLAWATALHTPEVDIFWRTSDDSGEALMPSTLVQALQAQGLGEDAPQSAWVKEVAPQPQQPPQPQAQALGVQRLSASAYDDLRTCPYRFFALRILGLQSDDELEQDVDKRDFGVWLHEVLSRFHRQLADSGETAPARLAELLDAAADAVSKAQGLAHAEFLPFLASWPAVRDHYLAWLQAHQASGYTFAHSELTRERGWQGVRLQGRLDRVDRQAQGGMLVLDYKTESSTRIRERIASPMEDTQMAFYGALLQEEGAAPLEGSYLMLSESECKAFAQPDMALAVQSLLDGIAHDLRRIGQGAALPALGEGDACTYCAARGLCRKDTWGSV